ncbi:Nn.00g060920.m01.CDS01 [Neocucurbitaria sp. VM-36]
MIIAFFSTLLSFALSARAQANIAIYPITKNDGSVYFSDPFHVPYQYNKAVYISGTTHKYLECDESLQPRCASPEPNKYDNNPTLKQAADAAKVTICSSAGIHPFQSGSDDTRSWDALVTLHVQDNPNCDGITGWSVIVHAHPENASDVDTPPNSWIGDKVLIGSFSENVDANYDGKYFQTPAGKLYLVYQKQISENPKRDGVVAWPMDNPKTKTPGSNYTILLLPDSNLNSENYVAGNDSFKLIETGNIRAINGKFLMAYSVGAFNHKTYKLGIAYSDTFLPADGQQYRKVMKNNPDHVWNSQAEKEVYYLLQADETHDGWHYVGDQVLAPGVPTVAKIGPNNGWVLTFAGYNPNDAPPANDDTNRFDGGHRRPYFINLDVNVPVSPSVKQASDAELQDWITPVHG